MNFLPQSNFDISLNCQPYLYSRPEDSECLNCGDRGIIVVARQSNFQGVIMCYCKMTIDSDTARKEVIHKALTRMVDHRKAKREPNQ